MPNKRRSDVQEGGEDARVERSVAAVRQAMVELLHEAQFEDITVQRILDRAGVARATFYSHYRNKDDVLIASFETMIRGLESHMDVPPRPRGRLVPVTELLEHFGTAQPVFDSLKAAGRMEAIWGLGTDLIADLIARRVALSERSAAAVTSSNASSSASAAPDAQRLVARMLAGACIEMIRWWLDRPAPPPASGLDAQFHAMAARVLRVGTAR